MVFGQDRQCQDWARLSGPKFLCIAFTQSRRGLVNMWKIIYLHSVWPNLNQDRRKLESPVSMSWEHPLPNAPLPDQTAHLRIRIMVIVKVKWSWSSSLFCNWFEFIFPHLHLLQILSVPEVPQKVPGWSWNGNEFEGSHLFPIQFTMVSSTENKLPNRIDSEIPLTSPQVSLRPRPSPRWSPPPCQTYQGETFYIPSGQNIPTMFWTKSAQMALLSTLNWIVHQDNIDGEKNDGPRAPIITIVATLRQAKLASH